jgi:hypothetical protein
MASAAAALKGILNETVGPMAVLTAGALAFVKYTAGAALNAEKMAAALRASAQARGLETQFKIIMGSAEMARKKVAELSKEAARSPFSFAALGKAAINLQVLSNGAYASSRALKQVQDVAIATGAPVDAVAAAMGDLVGSLNRGGDGASNAASQLAAMGAISQATAQKVDALAKAGAPAGEAMRLVEADTVRASGAAAEFSNTLQGLQQQLENLQNKSDTKIGAMFEGGAEAGARAAIGFQKFNSAVQESAAGPWAVIIAAFQGIKEAIGNFLGSISEIGAVQGVMKALGAASVAVFGVLAASAIQAALWVGGLAVKIIAATKAVQGMSAAMTVWRGLMTTAGATTLVAAAGLLYFAGLAYEAAKAVDALSQALDKQNKSGKATASNLRRQGASIVSSEDRQAALTEADTQLNSARQEAADARRAKVEADKKVSELGMGNTAITKDRVKAEAEMAGSRVIMADANVGRLQMERDRIAGTKSGMDKQQDARARRRMELEKQIKEDAYASAQSAANPKAQEAMASADYGRAKKRRAKADEDSKVTFAERQALNDATGKVSSAEPDAEKTRKGIEGIKAVTATTDAAKLSKAVALRETLKAQLADVEANSPLLSNGTPEEKRMNAEKRAVVQSQIAAIGGMDEISGTRIQGLQQQRDFAVANEDPNNARADEEAARNRVQTAKEAVAAEAALLAAKQRTLTLESALAGVADDGASAEGKAVAESNNRAQALKKALAAAIALEAAQANYAANPNDEAARQNVEKASVNAAGAGTEGRSVSVLQNAVSTEQQIKEANVQQARIQQAAAQARLAAAQRQLNMEKQMAQLNVERLDANLNGGNAPGPSKTSAGIQDNAASSKIAAEQQALAAAKLKEAAEAAVVASPNDPAAKAALEQANQGAEAAGVGGRSASTVQADLNSAVAGDVERRAGNSDSALNEVKSAMIASLRAQEKFGSNPEASRNQANAMEDTLNKANRTKELGSVIADPKMASQLASAQVDMERAASNMAEMGQPQVSEMASVGGSAGWGGLVASPIEELKKMSASNREIKTILDTMSARDAEALGVYKSAMSSIK